MGRRTGIEWTDHTWNPWRGCSHAVLADGSEHPGCVNCYAETMAKRNPKVLGQWGREDDGGTRVLAAHGTFTAPLRWNASAEQRGVRERVFLDSMHDLFDDWNGIIVDHKGQRAYEYVDWNGTATDGSQGTRMSHVRRRVFDIIDQCPWLDFLVLTKRPGNILRMADRNWTEPVPGFVSQNEGDGRRWRRRENVWLGTSISDQRTADELVPLLLDARALSPVLFLSCEPLLESLCLFSCLGLDVDWVIVGGESGHHKRPFDPEWARSIRDQCAAAGVPFFGKQWDKVRELPDDLMVRQFPKGADTCGQS